MQKCIILVIPILLLLTVANAQNKTTKEIEEEVIAKMDPTELALKVAAGSACKCIDSVYQNNKAVGATDTSVTNCITESVSLYDMTKQMMEGVQSKKKNITITVGKTENNKGFQENYYAVERRLKDSCERLNFLLSSNEKELDKSVSTNTEAVQEYDKGIQYFKKDNYKDALVYFEKAVAIDPVFAFAWDNIGVCNRKLGNYEKAINAYKESLKLEPKGRTALQNIALTYGFLKKYDESIAAYKDILKYYPDDPEVYYGIGVLYFSHIKDNVKAAENVAKAYVIYVKQKSAYRADAEKVLSYIYSDMKKEGKEEAFMKILKDNGINPN